MKTLPALCVLLLGALAGPVTGQESQAPPVVTRPPYAFNRWVEDWSVLKKGKPVDKDYADVTKMVPLNDSGSVWASFGGSVRFREEFWQNFNFGAPPGVSHSDNYGLMLLRAHGDFHFGDNYRLFAEFKSALATDRDLPGGTRPIDEDTAALQQFFLDARIPLGDGESLTFRPGRQQFAFGAQRLISPLPWANALRTWDGLSALYVTGGWRLTGLASAFVEGDRYGWDESSGDQQLYALYGTRPREKGAAGTDVYLLGNNWENTTFNGTSGRDERLTFGVRGWDKTVGRADWEVELDYQTGHTGEGDVSAWSIASQAGYSLGAERAVRMWAGFDWASGDERKGGSVQTFNQLYPLGHLYFGYADMIGRQNIIDTSLGATWNVGNGVGLYLGNHSFWADSTDDAIYNAGGAVLRPGGSFDSSWIGFESDVVATWQASRHSHVEGGFAYFWAGDAIEESGPSDDIVFWYLQYTFTF
jgi:hypothetical protein